MLLSRHQFRSVMLTIAFLLLSLIGFGQTIYVATTGNDGNPGTDINFPKLTIQAAINEAAVNTVVVAAGNYAENLVIAKDIVLQGAKVGSAGNDVSRGIGEAIIDPAALSTALTIGSFTVTIDGFQIGTSNAVSNANIGIVASSNAGLTITNNVIHSDSTGIVLSSIGTGSVAVTDNVVEMLGVENSNGFGSIGITLAGIAGNADVDVTNNDISDAQIGIGGFALTAVPNVDLNGGTITNSTTGILITNSAGALGSSHSTVDISNFTMSDFVFNGSVGGQVVGVYAFVTATDTDPDDDLTLTIDNLDISETTNDLSNNAGIIIADFNSGEPDTGTSDDKGITATISNSNIHDNDNRGIYVRGADASATISASSIIDNGGNASGSGAGIITFASGSITVENSTLQNPGVQTLGSVRALLSQQNGSITATNNSINRNGNGDLGDIQSGGTVSMSQNWLGTSVEGDIVPFMNLTGVDFTPWVGSETDNDSGTDGFQPDLDTLYIGSAGTQTGSTGRIDEAIGLVDVGGTIIANAGSYVETVTVNKEVSILGANQGTAGNGTRIDETILDPSTTGVGITIGANNVTIDGLQLGTSSSSSNLSTAILNIGSTGTTVTNNVVYSNGFGVTLSTISSGSVMVSNNLVSMLNLVDPQNANTPSIGMFLSAISSTADVDLVDNDISTASYGIAGYALTADNIEYIDGGNITGCTQGIAITNADGAGNFSRSIATIENITMSGFVNPGAGLAAPDAQAGIYTGTFTDGSVMAEDSVELTIVGVDISGTGTGPSDFAAINVVDFAGGFPFIDDDGVGVNVTITDANLHDNDNRGFTLRGTNATATVSRSTFTNNSNAAVVVSRLGHIDLTNNFIVNPGSGTPRAIVAQTDGTISGQQNSIDAGNGTIADGQDADDKIDLSVNYFGTIDEATIAGLIDATNTDFSPWIASGTDTNPSFSGFQPDLSTLHVGTSGDQAAGGIIQEGHDLVDTLGTVIVNGNSYTTDTLEVQKSITLSPLVALTFDELTTNGGSLTVDNDLVITTTVTLTNGIIDMDQDDGDKSDDPTLTVSGASIAGTGSDANHVEGKLAYQLTSGTFDFPVGDDGAYRPVTIAPTNFPSTFEVAHVSAAPSNLAGLSSLEGTTSSELSSVVQSVLEDRHWSIGTSDSPGSTNVTLQVSSADMEIEPGELSMVRNNAGTWEEQSTPMEVGTDPVDVTATATAFGDFSLISAFGMAPGNVSGGLQMWLKADNGVTGTSSITQWDDMSGANNDVTPISTNPALLDNAVNFNEVIDFSNDPMTTASNGILGANSVYSKFSVFQFDAATGNNMISSNTNGAALSGNGTDTDIRISHDGTSVLEATSALAADNYYLVTGVYGAPGSGNNFIRVNGTQVATNGSNSTYSDVEIQIGGLAGADGLDGKMAEAIVYNSEISGGSLDQVESYLAIKYGITLPVNYLAADGGTIWNTTTNTGYNNDIAGIGRDDFSGLDQRKSKSLGDSSLVTIALGNFDNPTTFTDNDGWLLWGSDGADSTFAASIDNAHSGTSPRMSRVWKVQETGTVGRVVVSLEGTASEGTVSLIVHDNTNFNQSDREVYEMVYNTTTEDYRAAVDLSDGDYFTFAEGPVGGIPAVLISEVIVAPRRAWSDDGFHNPEPIGLSSDAENEWIELYITEDGLDLSNWIIDMIDGGSQDSLVITASGTFDVINYQSLTGGLLQSSDSGDYVILGNPIQILNNSGTHIIIRNPDGVVVDQVLMYNEPAGTGFEPTSTGIEDESVSRLLTGTDTNVDKEDFVKTAASLGRANSTTGIVLINEIVTQPQTDWSTNDFDGSDGANTVSATDEWIELYVGTDGLNLTNWRVDITDGSGDISGTLQFDGSDIFTDVIYYPNQGGTFTDTRMGDYLVLGNPDNDMNNTPLIELFDASGNPVDSVRLGTGRAPNGGNSGFDEEAIARYPNATDTNTDNADFIQTRPTLGSTNSPTGTVVINEVVTDPFRDWDTNDFDGTYTTTNTDISQNNEWIELYISEDSINLSGWTMTIEADFTDGEITAAGPFTDAVYFSSTGGSFVNTRVGDYYVLGNPTDDMTNSTSITLKDATGTIVDELKLGGGAGEAPGGANGSIAEESVARIPNGNDTDADDVDFAKAEATLGRANSTAPVSAIGNALDFGGTDEFVQVSDVGSSIDLNTGAFTVEFWANVSSSNSFPLAKGTGGINNEYFFEIDGSGNIEFGVHGTNDAEQTSGLSTTDIRGDWHHIAGVLTPGSILIYIDGVLENQIGLAGALKSDVGDLFIGSQSTGDFITGTLDEIRIWNDIRTQEEILENLNSTIDPEATNLAAYYRFDQSTGTLLPDLTSNSVDGSLNNMEDADWITADWPVYAENSTIVQSASGNQTISSSGQLSITNATFLIDNDDILLVGHQSSDFDTVTTQLPTGTLVTNRYARSWHLTKNDAAGSNGGTVTMSFEIGQEPASSLTYYLLETSDPTTDFEVTPIVGYQPGATSIEFTLDVDSLTDEQYYTLGWSDAAPGNALDFDGVDDIVVINDDASLDLGTTATWEFWVKVEDITAVNGLLDKRTNATTQNAFSIGFNSGGTAIGSNFGIEASSDGTTNNLGASIDRTLFSNDQWHHVAITYNSAATDNFEIYLDGIPRTLDTSVDIDASLFNSDQELILGALDNGTTGFFNGSIDEVRIWNDVRTQDEIIEYINANLAGDEANLVSYYRFNQGIGNDPYNLPDLGGANNNGQLQDFDNLDNSTTSSNYFLSDRSSLDANVTIINTTVDVLTNTSDELTLTSTTSDFLQDEGDFITWGHNGNDFVEVATDLPASSNLVVRINRTWQLTKGDINDNDGQVTFAFDLGEAPNSDYTYYLLQRTGTAGDFDIAEVIGISANANSIEFTVDASQITSMNYFTLGRSEAGPGHALDLDGIDDYVSISDQTELDITGSLTLEAWVNISSLPLIENSGIVAKYEDGGEFSYSLQVTPAGLVVFAISGDGTAISALASSLTLSTDEWISVSAVYDNVNTSMAIYINGELDAFRDTGLIPGSLHSGSADLWLGVTNVIAANRRLNGQLDEVRIWSDVRTEDEIQANLYRSLDVANESNLVAYYKFNDGRAAGDNSSPAVDLLTDYSGNNLSGDLTSFGLTTGANSNWIVSEVPLADQAVVDNLNGPGNALAFDGTNEYVEVSDNDLLDITGALTLEAWINVTSSPTIDNEGIVSKFQSAGNERSYSLDITTSDNLEFTLSANGTNEAALTSTSSITTADGWTHVAAVYDPSNSMSIYIDGILDTELTAGVPAAINAGSADLWIAMTDAISANSALNASIDEVRIWASARTRVEIQDNMFKQLEGDEANLAAYYTFDEITGTSLPDESANSNTGTLQNMEDTDWITAAAREPQKNIQTNNWNTTTTWKSRAIPDATTEQLDLSQNITVDGSIDVDLLNINSGVMLTISAGQTLTVNGNFINNGSIVGDGTLVINGGSPSLYGGTINNLQLSGANATLMSATTVSNTLDLNSNSTLNIDDYNLTVSQIIGSSSSAFIETKNQNSASGYVVKSLAVADGDFTFPISSNGTYTPLTVTNLGSTGNIEARVFDNTYAQGTSGAVIDTEKEVNKSWEINGDAGVNVTVTLQWNATDEDPNYASARSTAYMSKNDYNWWEKITPDVGVTGSDPYMITASGIQTFSVFGTGTEDSSLPVTWMAFEAFENENQEVELHWSTASELNNDRFEVEKSFDGRSFQVIGEIIGNGTINSQSKYEFMDKEPFNGINYYRLRQVDYDGTDDYSEMVSVFVDVQREYNISLSPNPATDVTTLRIDWENDRDYAVGIFDMMGRNLGVVHAKFDQLNLDLTTLPKGMYIIKIHTGDKIIAKKLLKH